MIQIAYHHRGKKVLDIQAIFTLRRIKSNKCESSWVFSVEISVCSILIGILSTKLNPPNWRCPSLAGQALRGDVIMRNIRLEVDPEA